MQNRTARTITTPILQLQQTYVDHRTGEVCAGPMHAQGTLDLHAMCMFAALNFFWEDDTYYRDIKTLRPARHYTLQSGKPIRSDVYFTWHKQEKSRSFQQGLQDFGNVLDDVMARLCGNRDLLISISSGMDSRNLAAALVNYPHVESYSYAYSADSHENKIASDIAKACGWTHQALCIPSGYLWHALENIAWRSGCEEDPCIARQMGVLDGLRKRGRSFVLGHIGDILFDRPMLDALANEEKQIQYLMTSFVKPGGLWIGRFLWEQWGLEGSFDAYLRARFAHALHEIDIDDAAARIRALRLNTWTPRFTSLGVSMFDDWDGLILPFYDDAMAHLICEMPEAYLADRRLQTAYVQQRAPKLASIVWDKVMPYSIETAHKYGSFSHGVWRVGQRLHRMFQRSTPHIQRNWELQWLGDENQNHLQGFFENIERDAPWLGDGIASTVYHRFIKSPNREAAHALGAVMAMGMFGRYRCKEI